MRRLFLAAVAAVLTSTPASARAEATIVVVGDSLSSGYGLAAEQSWVAMLDERLQAEGYEYDVVNASIAGDTSAGGLARLPRLLETYSPEWVIIELGGNDGLRGQPVQALRDNLARMIELCAEHGARVLLAGIQLPPNYGASYTRAIGDVYGELAERYDAPLVPFLLDGVALDPSLMQGDGIHPNAAAQPRLLENVWNVLADLL